MRDSLVRYVITIFKTIRNRIVLIRSVGIIYILYFYCVGTGVVANLGVTAAASLCAHPLRRLFTIVTTTTLYFSN
jgi:hypothetical protein